MEEIGISYHKELKLFQRLLKLAQQFHLCLSCDTLRGDHTTLFAIFKHVVEVYHKSPDLGEVIWVCGMWCSYALLFNSGDVRLARGPAMCDVRLARGPAMCDSINILPDADVGTFVCMCFKSSWDIITGQCSSYITLLPYNRFTQLIGFQEADLLCILTSLLIERKQLLKISSLLR